MTDAFVVVLPLRLESESNVREHGIVRYKKRTKDYRGLVRMAVGAKLGGLHTWFHTRSAFDRVGRVVNVRELAGDVVVTLTRIAPCKLDAHDNLPASAKACVDGVADALGLTDRDERVTWRYAQRRGGVREYGVEIRVARVATANEERPRAHTAPGRWNGRRMEKRP